MAIFAITTFLSAFLLFQIQPLISRYILPWFGGAPSVWSAAMLFFQVFLLAGYAYADLLSQRTRRKLLFHAFLLAAVLVLLILTTRAWGAALLPGVFWRPQDSSSPVLKIFTLLSVSVGLPYFVLSTTSPLLQSWFSFLYPNHSPYRLYALSNFASFLALVSYPLFFEPRFDLPEQSMIWAIAFILYLVLAAILLARVFVAGKANGFSFQLISSEPDPLPEKPRQPSFSFKLQWVALPACSTLLLLSVTNQLTQEVAVIPFLWVLPLSVYLFSFTITFSGGNWYHRIPYLGLLGASTLLLSYAVNFMTSIGVFLQIVIYSLFLLVATLILHGELYRLKPAVSRLTSFYLLVSLGGALGGVFVSLVAPVIFKGYWELHLGVLLCWLLVILLLVKDRKAVFRRRWPWVVSAPLVFLVVGLTGYVLFMNIHHSISGSLLMQRNFYGVFRVRIISVGDPPYEAASLAHGITTHGFQFIQSERRRIATSYYAPKTGIGLAMTYFPHLLAREATPRGMRVGVVGLGAGTLAAYGQEGDYYRFYEINPEIINLALGQYGYFTYLQDLPTSFDVIPGDARLSLEHELARSQPQYFDILAIDAFNSDSIPVHLLTSEALTIYLAHLQPDGVLAIHISNRYLDLAPLIKKLADQHQLNLGLIGSHKDDLGGFASNWVLLSRNQTFFDLPEIRVNLKPIPDPGDEIRVWTDAYSNLLQFIRIGEFYRAR